MRDRCEIRIGPGGQAGVAGLRCGARVAYRVMSGVPGGHGYGGGWVLCEAHMPWLVEQETRHIGDREPAWTIVVYGRLSPAIERRGTRDDDYPCWSMTPLATIRRRTKQKGTNPPCPAS